MIKQAMHFHTAAYYIKYITFGWIELKCTRKWRGKLIPLCCFLFWWFVCSVAALKQQCISGRGWAPCGPPSFLFFIFSFLFFYIMFISLFYFPISFYFLSFISFHFIFLFPFIFLMTPLLQSTCYYGLRIYISKPHYFVLIVLVL